MRQDAHHLRIDASLGVTLASMATACVDAPHHAFEGHTLREQVAEVKPVHQSARGHHIGARRARGALVLAGPCARVRIGLAEIARKPRQCLLVNALDGAGG